MRRPEVFSVEPAQYLFLLCDDPEHYLYSSRDPLPAVFKLLCADTGELLPWITDAHEEQF